MSYGIKVKNSRGEIVTDGISDIGQHIGQGVATLNGYQLTNWDVSGITSSLNTSVISSITNNWASPYFRRSGDYIYAYNRLWFTLDPAPYFTASVLNVGRGEEDVGGSVYGFKVFGTDSNSIINSNSRTMRWVEGRSYSHVGATINGVYNGWVVWSTSYDISTFNFKAPPYVIISPSVYTNISDGVEYSRYAVVWYVSKTTLYIGTYLYQSAGFGIVIAPITYQMLLLTLD